MKTASIVLMVVSSLGIGLAGLVLMMYRMTVVVPLAKKLGGKDFQWWNLASSFYEYRYLRQCSLDAQAKDVSASLRRRLILLAGLISVFLATLILSDII